MGRPKTGRRYVSVSVSLTKEQAEFLHKLPNSSEMLRELIDDLMNLHGEIEPKLSGVALVHEINRLEKERNTLWNERVSFAGLNLDRMYKTFFKDPHSGIPSFDPIETPEAEYLRAAVRKYDEAVEALNARIKELKERVLKETPSTPEISPTPWKTPSHIRDLIPEKIG